MLYTLPQLYVRRVTQGMAAQILGQKTAVRFVPSYSGLCSNGTEHILESVSMAKVNLQQQETEFHPRVERLSSSSFHEKALSLCISLSRKCSWVPPFLSFPYFAHVCIIYCCTLHAVCYRSLRLLWSQLMKQSCKMGQGTLLT